jgi:zinc and cadmium transporter
MSVVLWILAATFAMSLLAWVGLLVMFVNHEALQGILRPLVGFAAGTLLGGAMLHLLPKTVALRGSAIGSFVWVVAGFAVFLFLEQFIEWRHSHGVLSPRKQPVTYLILLADAVHNFIGGLAIGGSFLVGVRTGLVTWIAAAAHEVPQELGDFGVLVHGGWKKKTALIYNFLSALTVVAGGVVAYALAGRVDTTFLLPFAAGNFIYIACSGLIPEIKHAENMAQALVRFGGFLLGVLLLLAVKLALTGKGAA